MTVQEKLKLIKEGYSQDQLDEIIAGENSLIDTSCYLNVNLSALQMKQVRMALEEGLDIEPYSKPDFDWFQLEEIRLGLEADINVRIYAYPKVPYDVMREIRLGLKDGINLGKYANFKAGVIKQIRKASKSDVDIMGYVERGYDEEQLEQIRVAFEQHLKIQPYLNPSFRGISIAEIRIGLKHRIDVSPYANLDYNWRQMREIRLGLEHQVDVKEYMSPLYDWQQMQEIRLGLESGYDVSYYNSLMYTAAEMAKRRQYYIEHIDDLYEEGKAPVIVDYDNFSITIDKDEMNAYLRMNGMKQGITKEGIIRVLRSQKIVDGINYDEIDELVKGNRTNQTVLIAKGNKPTKGRDGWYEFFFKTNISREPKVLEDGSLDYQNIEWFEQVVRGQKLAYYHEAEEGNEGYTVTGKYLPGTKGKQLGVIRGSGFKIDDDRHTYIATAAGIINLRSDNTIMEISNLLVVDEVTASTGNVVFTGSVQVRKNVGVGAYISATEDILVDGFVEGATLEAGRNITIRKGVNADGKGSITAGRDISSNYIETATVKCVGDLNANYILNSNVYCESGIKISGRRGSIIGNTVYGAKKIEVNHVGNAAGVRTILKLGVNDNLIKNQVRCENIIKTIDKDLITLEHLREEICEKMPPEERNINETFIKVENAIFTKKEQRKEIEAEKAEWDRKIALTNIAKAIINGHCYANVIIDINGRRWISEGADGITVKTENGFIEAEKKSF